MSREATQLGELMVRLQRWYGSQCDGDWEHSFGVKLDTLDNPGWLLTIDLNETPWANADVRVVKHDRSETDWYQCEVTGHKFTGCGGTGNLADILEAFFRVVKD